MKPTKRDHFRTKDLPSEEILDLTPQMQVAPPALPATVEPLPSAEKPAQPTVMARYARATHLGQLLGITEVARLPFELADPRFACSSLHEVSRELTISCTLIALLYEKLGTLKPWAAEIDRQADWALCHECIKAEREIRDRLLLVESGLANRQRHAA